MDVIIAGFIQKLAGLGEFFTVLFDIFFSACSIIAEEGILIVVILFVYWCYDKRLGEGLLLSLYFSMSLNAAIKDSVMRLRPFLSENADKLRYLKLKNPLIDTVSLSSSYSFPSGHSQLAATLLCANAVYKKKKTPIICCVVLIPLVMLSRIYLGVHYPSDTLVGAALGIASGIGIMYLFGRFYEKRYMLFTIIFVLSLGTLFLSPTADTFKTIGIGLGGLVGFWTESKCIGFSTDISAEKKALRIIFGASVILVLRVVLKIILPPDLIFGAVRYFIIGIMGTAVMPLVFKKLKM